MGTSADATARPGTFSRTLFQLSSSSSLVSASGSDAAGDHELFKLDAPSQPSSSSK